MVSKRRKVVTPTMTVEERRRIAADIRRLEVFWDRKHVASLTPSIWRGEQEARELMVTR
jgi:hypothetical protein